MKADLLVDAGGVDSTALGKKELSKRDYIIVPLLIAATVVVMLGLTELGTRAFWPEQPVDKCTYQDRFGIFHAVPNCTSTTKIAEGPAVTYHFNSCGYRTFDDCGAKPPGAIRIVLLGSSNSEGLHVPYDQTFADRTAKAIAKATDRTVQIENFGLPALSPLTCYERVNEAIRLHPDLVVYPVASFDLDQVMDPVQLAHRNDPNGVPPGPLFHYAPPTMIKRLQIALNDSRTFLIAQHFLFTNTDTFLRIYMSYGQKADYLRKPMSAHWKARYADFDLILTDMAARFKQAGIPFLLMAVPSRPQAALLSVSNPPPNSDAYAFDRELKQMAGKLGIGYVDGISEFATVPHSDQLFYIVESHIKGEGHAVLARALIRKCLDGSVPTIKQ